MSSELMTNRKDLLHVFVGASFIPLLGIIFLVPAIALSRLERPERWTLALIALSGILLVFYLGALTLNLQSWRRDDSDIVAHEVRDDLVRLIKDVEFFHQTKGRYPETLGEATGGSEPMDWLSVNEDCKLSYFYALSADKQKYTLRSVGRDRTAFTSDDVLPALENSVLARTGFDPGHKGPTTRMECRGARRTSKQ